jgi:acetoin:2,6-dichlorophenolindophenol oxidoreductase subunit alpha
MDLPGHGSSSKEVETGDREELVACVTGLMDALSVSCAHIVGHSLGSAVAVDLAGQFPAKVASLTLLSGLGHGTDVDASFIDAFLGASDPEEMRTSLGRLFADPERVTLPFAEETLRNIRAEETHVSLRKIADAAVFDEAEELPAVRLERLDVPIQVIWGREDQITSVTQTEHLPDAVDVHVVDRAGHMVHIEAGDRIGELVSSWAASAPSIERSEPRASSRGEPDSPEWVGRSAAEDDPSSRGADRSLTNLYRKMLTVRLLERRVKDLVEDGRIPCSGHFGLGQEAVGVGVGASLETEDYLFGTHRGFAEYIGKGMRPSEILAEYYGKATSPSRGRLGQHLLRPDIGIMPLPSSLGSEFGMSVGTALSSQYRHSGQVTLNIFGEGTATQADFGPSLEMASLWRLPLVFVCNNNQYVELDGYRSVVASEDIAPRAAGYGIDFDIIDGNDIRAVCDAVRNAIDRARSGDGPVMLECKTYRRGSHYTGDPGRYQSKEEIAEWEKNDPIERCRQMLTEEAGWDREKEQSLLGEIEEKIDQAVTFAEDSPFPDPQRLDGNPYAETDDE